jgi:superfamily II DNA or RNA helicase
MLSAWTYVVPDPDDSDEEIEVQLYRDLGNVHSFCRGDLAKIGRHFPPENFQIIDKRVAPPMQHPLRMKTELYTPDTDVQGRNQQEVMAAWLEHGYGQIMAPARFGKTLVVSAIVVELGLKALILSHQWDILDQFERTIREHTDVEDTEKLVGHKLVSRLDKYDWDKLDDLEIILSSWQSWWHPNNRRYLKKWRDQFGIILVDESHLSQADCYSKVVNAFNAKFRCGNTATPFKQNELHVIIENIIGPVVAEGVSRQMVCSVSYIHTDIQVEKFGQWTTLLNRLTKDSERNQLIVEHAVSDANRGRHILITTDRVAHAKELARMVNAAGISAIHVTGNTTERDALWDRARSGDIKVVVAMRRITRLGIDVPLWDTFYNILPTSDPFNYYQELSRIRTYYKGKPVPIIKDFIDDPDKDARGAILGTMTKRDKVYREQGFKIQNAAFSPPKPKRLSWGRRTRKKEDGD